MADTISRVLLREAALNRGLQVSYVGPNEYFMKLTHPDGRWDLLRGTMSMRCSALGSVISKRKYLTTEFVETLGISTPPTIIYSSSQIAADFLSLYKQIVVKPADSMQSRGVTTNVATKKQLKEAVGVARRYAQSGEILLQKQLSGKLYRLFVLDGKLIAAAHRRAAAVTGDGSSTVEQLIIHLNQDPRRSDGAHTMLKRVDKIAAAKYLGTTKFNSVLPKGQQLQVSPLDSISAGGEAANVTEQVNPQFATMAEMIAQELRLFVCGLDIMCDDIGVAPRTGFLPLLEINSMPGLKLHHFPTAGGKPVDVAGKMIDALFPPI